MWWERMKKCDGSVTEGERERERERERATDDMRVLLWFRFYWVKTSAPHRPVHHTDQYTTPTSTLHRQVQHTDQYITPTSTPHRQLQHTNQYATRTSAAHRPVQHTDPTPHRWHTSFILCIKTYHITDLVLTPQTPNSVHSHNLNTYPLLAYIHFT